MVKLKFQTASQGDRKPRLVHSRSGGVAQSRIKGYFIKRCPWTGYFYAKGSRARRCNGAWGRAIVGMKWSYYRRTGLRALKDHTRDFRFLRRSSIRSELIHGQRVVVGMGAPLQEGPMVASSFVRVEMPRQHRNVERQERSEERIAAREQEGRPRIRAVNAAVQMTRHKKGIAISTPTAGRPRRMEDEGRDVMWFPGIEAIIQLPENFTKQVQPREQDVSPVRLGPLPKNIVAKTIRAGRPRSPKVSRTKKTVARIAQKKRRQLKAPTIARPLGGKKAKKSVMIRLEKTSVPRSKVAEARAPTTTHQDPVVLPWELRKEHLPTIGWIRRKERQLKVALGAEAVPPRQ